PGDLLEATARLAPNRANGAVVAARAGKLELGGRDRFLHQEVPAARQRLLVGRSQTEAVRINARAIRPGVRVSAQAAVAADQAAQGSAAVVGVVGRWRDRASGTHQLCVHRQVRPAKSALFGPGDMLPTTASQEAV